NDWLAIRAGDTGGDMTVQSDPLAKIVNGFPEKFTCECHYLGGQILADSWSAVTASAQRLSPTRMLRVLRPSAMSSAWLRRSYGIPHARPTIFSSLASDALRP